MGRQTATGLGAGSSTKFWIIGLLDLYIELVDAMCRCDVYRCVPSTNALELKWWVLVPVRSRRNLLSVGATWTCQGVFPFQIFMFFDTHRNFRGDVVFLVAS